MLKEVDVSDLKVGMYVHDLGRSWLQHPFASNHFVITAVAQIRRIREAGIRNITIDTAKGLQRPTMRQTQLPDREALEGPDPDAAVAPVVESPTSSLQQELGRAVKIQAEAIRIIAHAMEEVRRGHKIQVRALTPAVEDIVASIFRNRNALIGLMRIRRKDQYTYEHSLSASVLLTAFGHHLGMGQADLVQVGMGGLLMDIGKVRIPPGILEKPGRLNGEETLLMHRHVEYGRQILRSAKDIPSIALDIVNDHHERLDGSGYPHGKAGDAISFHGMMAAIVDVYDALSTQRVYRRGISPHTALRMLVERKNTHFHTELVYGFVHCVGVYPIGTLVQLSDGRFAVVLEPAAPSDALSPLPRVRVVYDLLSRRYLPPTDIDLAHPAKGKALTIVGAQEPAKWHIEPERYLDHARVC
jgi:HD-GYP domain-containing protein (c-di-GMP phosphodiesterase class II)